MPEKTKKDPTIVVDEHTDKIVSVEGGGEMALSLDQSHLARDYVPDVGITSSLAAFRSTISDVADVNIPGAVDHLTQAQTLQGGVASGLDDLTTGLSKLIDTPVSSLPAAFGALSAKTAIVSLASKGVSKEIQSALDDLATPPPPPPPPAEALIFECKDIVSPGDMPSVPGGICLGMTLMTGVAWFPKADNIYRKLFGGNSSKGKHGAFCIGMKNTGQLEFWLDDGTTIKIGLGTVLAEVPFYFAAEMTGTVLTAQEGLTITTIDLPLGIVPFDGEVVVGQGFYNHTKCDPINPSNAPAAKLTRLRAYRDVDDPNTIIKADAAEWASLLVVGGA